MKQFYKTVLTAIAFVIGFNLNAGNEPKLPTGLMAKTNSGISFTENKGQVHDQNYKPRPDVLFGVTTGNMVVHIKKKGVSYQLYRNEETKGTRSKGQESRNLSAFAPPSLCVEKEETIQSIYRIDLTWLNHNSNFNIKEDEALTGYENYYLENCANGALLVKSYKGITLKNLYEGIDLHYYQKNGELKHDYIVAAYADYKQIQVLVEGAEISLNKDGFLLLTTPLGKVQEGAPIVYQNGRKLKAQWRVTNNVLQFDVDGYDPAYELIIDPVTRLWGTYYGGGGSGGAGDDRAMGCVTDASGNVFMAGYTNSSTSTLIATIGAHQSTNIGSLYSYDGFLVKFDAHGVRQWGTYCGGLGNDFINACATDPSGNVFVAGNTNSTTTSNISTLGSHQSNWNGNSDAFLVKFDNNGLRLWGTYYGGSSNDYGTACTTDLSGNVYMCGTAGAYANTIIATPGSHQAAAALSDGYLVKFDANGVRQWGTYYGASSAASGGLSPNACCTDPAGNVVIGGTYFGSATNTSVATPGSHQPAFGGTITSQGSDAFLAKFNSSGVRQWGTYYGSQGNEQGRVCVADGVGNIYLSGYAENNVATGSIIATPACHQYTNQGGDDGFLAKFAPSGVRLWGTYYGGNQQDRIQSCVIDASDNVYIAGYTQSFAVNFVVTGTAIATSGCYQDTLGGLYQGTGLLQADAFLVRFNPGGTRQWGTYYGGASSDAGNGCATDLFGHVYLCGFTGTGTSTVIATTGSHQSTLSLGTNDAFLVKFDQCTSPPTQPLSFSGTSLICAGSPATFSTPLAYAANYYTLSLPGGISSTSNTNSITVIPVSSGIFTLVASNACGVSQQQTLNITVNPSPTVVINSGQICVGQSFSFVVSGANTYTFSSTQVVTPAVTTTYSVTGTNTQGCTNSASSTILVNPNPIISVNSGSICFGDTFTINPSGAATYTIQGGSSVVSPTTTSNYSVAGSSAAGCVSSNAATAIVSVNQLPTITASTTNSVLCAGEEATLTASGALNYTFTPGGASSYIIISPSITTTYSLTGTHANGCSKTEIVTQNVSPCTSLSQLSTFNTQVSVYPNPTNGEFIIDTPSETDVTIMNALGQIIKQHHLIKGQNKIDLIEQPNGIYLVLLKLQGKLIRTEKIVKGD